MVDGGPGSRGARAPRRVGKVTTNARDNVTIRRRCMVESHARVSNMRLMCATRTLVPVRGIKHKVNTLVPYKTYIFLVIINCFKL